MVRVYGAGTIPVNGPAEPFVLTRIQLWQALQRKIRHPSEFVPVLSSCKINSDVNGVVDREVVLDFGKWGKRAMHEIVSSHGDLWVCKSFSDITFTLKPKQDPVCADRGLRYHQSSVLQS
jgi:hypothetical protein